MNEQEHPEIDSVLSDIELDHTIAQMNDTTITLRFHVSEPWTIEIADFTILPGGELMLYRAVKCPSGKSHPHLLISHVFASGEWMCFERVNDNP